MRQAGVTWVAVAALMAMGAPIAEAGITCKIIPSWCPDGNNKTQRVGLQTRTGHSPGNSNGDSNNSNNKGNGGKGSNGEGFSQPSPPANDAPPRNDGGPGTISVPEPATMLLFALGAGAAGAAAFRRRKKD